jgi:hypothetical protein
LAFLYTVTDNTLIGSNAYNRNGNNNGPVEVRAARGFFTYSICYTCQIVQLDDNINEITGGLMIGSIGAHVVALLAMFGLSRANKCQAFAYILVAFFGVVSMGLSIAAVVVWGTSDMEKSICWRFEEQSEDENGVQDANCNYGAAFYAAIVGSVMELLFVITFFTLVSAKDYVSSSGTGAGTAKAPEA